MPVIGHNGDVAGTVSLFDLVLAAEIDGRLSEPVQRIMVSPPVTVNAEMPVEEFFQQGLSMAVVKDLNEVVGLVTPLELQNAIQVLLKEVVELREAHQLERAIINSVYDGVYITDGQGYTLDVNDAYVRITGIPREEIVGRHMKELIDEGYFKSSASLMVLETRQPVTIIDNIRGGVTCLTTSNPVFNEKGQIIRVVSSVRDMTELAELKSKLEQANQLNQKYEQELELLRRQQLQDDLIIGQHETMRALRRMIEKVAKTDATVLILGETGVGKELVAKEIQRLSPRRNGPFIRINCAAVPEHLIESELFGYERGAFTGANSTGKPGIFELAESGTILLDEIAELPMDTQAKLLRVLQEKEVTRLGGTRPRKLDVRILAATNKDLEQQVAKGLFRKDLYYRLNILPITVPPLRERREDIPLLVDYFLRLFNRKYGTSKSFSRPALHRLCDYSWPGNVRELRNLVERLVIVTQEDIIGPEHLVGLVVHRGQKEALCPANSGEIHTLKEAVRELERHLISEALRTYGSTHRAAHALGVSQPTVLRKIKKLGIKLS